MHIIIQKLPNIEGDVILLDYSGNENPVYDDYREYNLQIPPGSPMELVFRDFGRVFMPNGPGDVFMDGGVYTIMQMRGNELFINNDNYLGNNPTLTWIDVM